MFPIFKKKSVEDHIRRDLFDFLAEMEKNLEFFYVMDQRQFITHGFLNDAWPRVKNLELIKQHETIAMYASAMEHFNSALKEYKDFEVWYTADVNRKSPDNARKLHTLKQNLDQKLKTLEAVIIPAGQDLEREMLKLGLLKA